MPKGLLNDPAPGYRDRAISAALKKILEPRVKRYGRLARITLDSAQRSILIELLLHGETEPVALSIGRYDIVTEAERRFLVMHDIRASREWIERLAQDFLEGRTMRIPAALERILSFLK
jgi:hypothetical protein